jgi:DNA modification methylase
MNIAQSTLFELNAIPQKETFIELDKKEIQRNKLEKKYSNKLQENLKIGSLVSYQGNKNIPILRLYRYKEAFSYQFVKDFFSEYKVTQKDYVFDPFCGMGTTLFTSCVNGIQSVGTDRLPIGVFISETLPKTLTIEPNKITEIYENAKYLLADVAEAEVAEDVRIMKIAFPPKNLTELRKWKTVIQNLENPYKEIIDLLYLAVIEPCSFTAKDGQFLRYLPDREVFTPTELLDRKVKELEQDLLNLKTFSWDKNFVLPAVYQGDTRDLSAISFEKEPTFILTSPPYANRYDYTRSYSLELCFNFIQNFDELKALRFGILRSHIEAKEHEGDGSVHEALTEILQNLEEKNQIKKLNNNRIPIMLIAYFVDMQKVIKEWYRVCAKNATVVMVVDNVRFEGEHVPVDLILSDLAEQAGFEVEKIIVARYKGNSSQQMGKYGRFPVRESIMIWRKK